MSLAGKNPAIDLQSPQPSPTLIDVGEVSYITIQGVGNPNSDAFASRVGILYALSYGLKMLPKKGINPEGYTEYSVYPLEGLWDLSEVGRQQSSLDKNELIYSIMIRQPSWVNEAWFETIQNTVFLKTKDPLVKTASLLRIRDGLSVQMLHIGSYDTEPISFAKMHAFIEEHHLVIKTLVHREIYLSDARRCAPAKLKTILRYQVSPLGKDHE